MKKWNFVFTLLLLSNSSFCQERFYNIQVSMGITSRKGIRSNSSNQPFYPFYYEMFKGKQLLSIDIKKKFFEDKLTLQFANNLTFGLLRRGQDINGQNINESSLRRDHFIDLLYAKNTKFKKLKLLVGAGYGVINANTSFVYNRPYNGNTDNLNILGNYRFLAPRITIGLEKGVFNTYIILNYTGRDNLYNKTPAYNWEYKGTITFPKFKKNGKKGM